MSDINSTSKDEIELQIEKAQLEAKRERRVAIGNLLDKATDVLTEILDSDDPARASQRMHAAEVAINLYIQQENGIRQDKLLEVQEKRLDLEVAKLQAPGGPLFQQNNVYLTDSTVNKPEDTAEADALLARKRAQDALLASFLPNRPKQVIDESSENTVLPIDDSNRT